MGSRDEAATVYRGGRRRYLTLKAACRAEARQMAMRAMSNAGCHPDEYDALYRAKVERVARALELRFKRRTAHDNP